MVLVLPRFIALKSVYNNRYLRFINQDVHVHGFFKFSGEEVASPFSKFEVEPARCGNGLVHLRCCYNNRYFVRWSPYHWWIVGAADQTEEDMSEWTCTLFKPIIDDQVKTVKFVHVQLGHHACLWRAEEPFTDCLFAGAPDDDKDLCDLYSFTDLETLFVLPKHVAFKGPHGDYVCTVTIQGRRIPFLPKDADDQMTAANEALVTRDGSILVSVNHFNQLRKANPDWPLVNTNNDDSYAQFWPLKLDKALVALCNLDNNNFGKRFDSTPFTTDRGLSANASTSFEVSEIVTSREIYDVTYHPRDARVVERSITLATETATNENNNRDIHELEFTYTNTRKETWSSTVSSKLFDTVILRAGTPVMVGERIFEQLNDFERKYKWGETMEISTQGKAAYKSFFVPARTKMTIGLVATRVSYDIPFSYTQEDTLTNGEIVEYKMEDGIYSGVCNINFKFEITKKQRIA